MRCQSLLLGGEWHPRGRRRLLRDHLPIRNRHRRSFHVVRGSCPYSQYTLPSWCDWYSRCYRGGCQLLWIGSHRCASHWLCRGECLLWHNRYRIPCAPVDVVDICDRGALVHDRSVVHISNGGRVDRRVAHVHPVEVSAAHG